MAPTARRYPGPAVAATQRFLSDHADVLKVRGLALEPWHDLALGGTHAVSYRQWYGGLPVFGKSAVVRIDQAGRILSAGIEVARNLTVSTRPKLAAQEARRRVAAFTSRRVDAGTPATLGILPWTDVGGYLVWYVDLLTRNGMDRFVVDAHRGNIIDHYSIAHGDGQMRA